MSRELLKRAVRFMSVVGCSNDDICELCDEIETFLAQTEPEPVGWLYDYKSIGGMRKNEFTENKHVIEQSYVSNVRPLYTTQPDQSAQISELIAQRTGGV